MLGTQPQQKKPAPIMLVMCGASGSGKSTFANNLCAASPSWERVNQDTVSKGRRGTRQQCLALAERRLLEGLNVIIDRCHVEAEQRRDFLQLSKRLGFEAHAVVLDLPAKTCAEQAAGRAEHEGGLDGPQAHRVAYGMAARLRNQGLPSKSEGFASILVCRSHGDIARALGVWKEFPRLEASPEQLFLARGGGKRTLAAFFAAPRASQQAMAASPPSAAAVVEPARAVSSAEANAASLDPQLATGSQQSSAHQDQQTAGGQAEAKRLKQAPGTPPGEEPAAAKAVEPEGHGPGTPKKNAFAALMAGARQAPAPAAAAVKRRQFNVGGGVLDALRRTALDPERERAAHPGMIVSARHVIVRDKFPKAKLHGLVVARDPALLGPADLTAEHLGLLEEMQEAAVAWVKSARAEDPSIAPVALGFHTLPSMAQLHLHIISQDFDSPSLKTKKHWNSFTTAFFLALSTAKRQLEGDGRIEIDEAASKALLAQQLCCHKCGEAVSNMPKLKAHIASCLAPLDPQQPVY